MDKKKSELKKEQIIEYISKYSKENGYPPSIREICKAVGFKSSSSGQYYVSMLVEQGYLCKGKLKTRTLKVVDNQEEITADKMFEELRV